MDTVLEERVWVWQYWVPKGALVLLSALPKAGKTTFIARLIMHLVTGQPFLGYGVTKTAVLMLAVEEQKYDVYSRFRKLIIPKEAELHIHTGFLHMNDKSMAAIEAFINTHKIGAVVIDTLSHFWPVKDENDNAEVSIHMRRLLELRDKTGVTIILIHHQRKNSGEGIANGTAIRGAGALLASVDQALTLQRTIGGKCRRTLSSIGRYTDTPEEVIIELKDGVYNALGSPQATDDKDAFNRLLTILGAGPKTAAQLSVGSGIDERRVRKLLDIHGGHLGCKGTGERGDPFTWFIK
jgi:KaiC/GvpD/RAD55 family RecA-like ATPase